MIGLKVHLVVYGLLLTAAGALYLQKNHYQEKSAQLTVAYNTLEASYKATVEHAAKLENLFEEERRKSEVIETEHAKALAQLHEMGTRNAQVKTYFDIDVPSELNDRLRAKYPTSQNGKTGTAKKPVKRLSKASVRWHKNKRLASSNRKSGRVIGAMQQRQSTFTAILSI